MVFIIIRCGGCLSSSHNCVWCAHSAQCTAVTSCTPNVSLYIYSTVLMIYTPITDTLQVTTADSCPRLITPSGLYTLHMNDISVNEQLVINGSNFIEVLTSSNIYS